MVTLVWAGMHVLGAGAAGTRCVRMGFDSTTAVIGWVCRRIACFWGYGNELWYGVCHVSKAYFEQARSREFRE